MKVRIKPERLARELARGSLSLNGWGQRLGLSKGHLSLLLNGKRRYPNPDTRRKLLDGLSLSFDDLFEIEDGPQPTPRQAPRLIQAEAARPASTRLNRKGDGWMRVLLLEWRYALRSLTRRPGLALAAVLTLALGIGSVTVVFGVVEAVLLRPLPFPDPSRLALLGAFRNADGDLGYLSRPELLDCRQLDQVFESVAASEPWLVDYTGGDEPRQLSSGSISDGFFKVLGIEPLLGREFLPQEHSPAADPVVILSQRLFQSFFQGSPQALGKTLLLDGYAYEIVGVMPEGFSLLHPGLSLLEDKDLWIPMKLEPGRMRRNSSFTRVIARLQPSVSWEQAQAEMTALASRLLQEHPDIYNAQGYRLRVLPLQEQVLGGSRPVLAALLGAVGLLLLLVCFNLATLQLARAETRQGELTVRLALGASRWRLLRQSLGEGLLLALGGAAAGLLAAVWGLDLLRSFELEILPRLDEARIDTSVLGMTLAASLASMLIFNLAPAWLSTGMLDQVRVGATRATASRRRTRVRSALVVAEVALALVLLTGSGLMMRSLMLLLSVDPGFDADRVLTFRLMLSDRYPNRQDQFGFFERVSQDIRELPQVESVGLVDRLPFRWGFAAEVTIEGRDSGGQNRLELAQRYVGGDYFPALGIEVLQGRTFDSRDQYESLPVTVIDDRLAARLWPGQNPLGKRLKRGNPESNAPWSTIVGVVRHVKLRGLDSESRQQVYFPHSQRPFRAGSMFVTVKGRSGEAESLIAGVRQAVWNLDRRLPLSDLKPMSARVSESLSQRRFNTFLFGLFALIGLALGAVGILGVVSHSVNRRIREIGLRMALGAGRGEILRWVVSRGMRLTALGLLLGFAGSLALTQAISSLLFGVGATDPPTLAAAAAFLSLVALTACWLPARRASRVDPAISLRWE